MSASARTRREVSMREVGALAAGAIVLSVVMTWPLVLHLGENVPKDLTDPLPQAWQIACYVLWSTDGFPELVNGRSSVEPAWTARLVRSTHRFPNRASVERLRHVGVRSVILDLIWWPERRRSTWPPGRSRGWGSIGNDAAMQSCTTSTRNRLA